MEGILWNAILSVAVGVILMLLKGRADEVKRLDVLLNKTREEIAGKVVTRDEFKSDTQRIIEKFETGINRLEAKIDDIRNRQRVER
jgi:hypothetical protein